MWKKYRGFIISIAIALAVGGLSALLTSEQAFVHSSRFPFSRCLDDSLHSYGIFKRRYI